MASGRGWMTMYGGHATPLHVRGPGEGMLGYRWEALEREATPSSGFSGTPPCSHERGRRPLFDEVSACFLLFEVCMSARRELSDRSVDM